MGWKDWPYWLKGGIIGLSLLLLSLLVEFLLYLPFSGFGFLALFYGYSAEALISNPTDFEYALYLYILPLVTVIVVYFLAGALIGWIYGLIKKRFFSK